MNQGLTWYIATVWFTREIGSGGPEGEQRVIMRLPASTEDKFRELVVLRALQGKTGQVDIGPISEAKYPSEL